MRDPALPGVETVPPPQPARAGAPRGSRCSRDGVRGPARCWLRAPEGLSNGPVHQAAMADGCA